MIAPVPVRGWAGMNLWYAPPGVPALAPGEVITAGVLDYLLSAPPAGVLVPDAADPSLETLRVVAGR